MKKKATSFVRHAVVPKMLVFNFIAAGFKCQVAAVKFHF